MTAKVKLLALLAVIGVSTAALTQKLAGTNPDYPGHCWEEGKAHKPGQSWPIQGSCSEGRCSESSGNLYVSLVSCGSVAAGPSCYITDYDLSKSYPDCCPDVRCS
ncbi:U-scoloptoxin(16)-Ssd1a-like [Panulirus ornatus]|uniref:U-scoloptoxin(16)-Ssd1a-like n=1 Tax=Panulirus ornatus TaxID=150431 RepID=UPI003A890931